MWDFLGDLIYALVRIWRVDSELRDQSSMTRGSEFDRQSRGFVARLFIGVIVLVILVGLVLSYLTRSQ